MRRAALASLLLLVAAWAAPVLAAPGSLATACSLDFQLFCAELDPESPRAEVEACLRKNQDILTEECRAVLDPASVPRPPPPAQAGIGGACREDFREFCRKAGDRMEFARCVRKHRDEFSPACRDALDQRKAGAGHGPGRGVGAGPGGRGRP